MTPRDVFISHSSDDIEAARALRSLIEEAGYTSWMAPDDIVGTETWTEQILAGIANSTAMVVLVSAASNKSPHVSREVNLALGKGRPVLPVRIEDVAPGGSLEYLLSLVQRVDAFPPPVTVHRDRILRQLDTIVPRPLPKADPASGADDATQVIPAPSPVAPAPVAPAPQPPAVVVPSPPPLSIMTPPVDAARPRPPALPIVPIAIAAVAVIAIVAVIGSGILGPGASPSPSSVAIATQVATAVPGTQAASGGVPSAGATAGGGLTAPQQALRDRLPLLTGLDQCVAWPTPPGGEDVLSPSGYADSTARISCPVEGSDAPVHYVLYPSTQSLDADFATLATSVGVASGGACKTAIPADSPWAFPNSPNSGDLACFERNGKVQYVWTQRQLGILVEWLAPDNAAGFAFWKTWTSTFNAAEADLLARLPPTVDDAGACVRAADRYYPSALALITCLPPSGTTIVYYAAFPDASAFPNDPMTQQFASIMAGGGWPTDTQTGCYDDTPTYGRYTWAFKDTSGNLGPTAGYLGCYLRTDTTPEAVQYAWTYNASSVMGLWAAPDLATGIAYFDSWIANLPR